MGNCVICNRYEVKNNMPKLSIIIPVYNVENYISECIESLVNQTLQDIEIIAVDDGSSDASGRILDELQQLDKRIVVIHNEHNGVTSARNTGIKVAQGDYIAFVDGDDYVAENMYEELYDIAIRYDVEVVFSQMFFRVMDNDNVLQGGRLKEGLYCSEDRSIEVVWNNIWNYEEKNGLLPFMWCNLYCKDKLLSVQSKIPYDVRFSEDEMMIYSLVVTLNRMYVVNKPYYFYRMRSDSAVNSINENFLIDLNKRYLFIKEYYSNHYMSNQLLEQLKYKTVNDLFSLRFIKMGASNFHMFPYEKIPYNSRLVLYAAGDVGKSYYYQLKENNYCKLVLWTDARYRELCCEKYCIESPDKLLTTEYDYILIAILNETMAEKVAEDLINTYGVSKEKIIMHVPKSLLHFLDI